MAEPTDCSSVAASVFAALETLVETLPSVGTCEFDRLPDDQAQLPAISVETRTDEPAGRPYVDGGVVSRCQLDLALRHAGDDSGSRIEACELLATLARSLSEMSIENRGAEPAWLIEGCSQPYRAESGAGVSDYRVTLSVTYRTRH